jgi:lipopolysaccharide export system protein LptA
MRRALAFAVFLLSPAAFAATAPITHHDANQPIAISSDNFVAEKNPASAGGITGTYSGNVIIIQGDSRMRSDTVRIMVVNNKPQKIYFNGNVVVNSTSGTASGDAGVYDVVPRLVTLTGHVVLTKEKNVMRGAQLTVNLVTGIARLGGGADGTHGRVQGLFTPPPQSNGSQ